MIGALNGCPLAFDNGVLSLRCGSVTYEINVGTGPLCIYDPRTDPAECYPDLFYWIHLNQPEKGPPELYGFREKDERDTFRRLLQIDGIGCKVAMRIVTAKAVLKGSLTVRGADREFTCVPLTLKSVRGVGPKLYERIIEELSK